MVGLIFGIIFLIAGIVCAVAFEIHTDTEEQRVEIRDENGQCVRDNYGNKRYTTTNVTTHPLKKFSKLSTRYRLVHYAYILWLYWYS